jgi:hypothetical protein
VGGVLREAAGVQEGVRPRRRPPEVEARPAARVVGDAAGAFFERKRRLERPSSCLCGCRPFFSGFDLYRMQICMPRLTFSILCFIDVFSDSNGAK